MNHLHTNPAPSDHCKAEKTCRKHSETRLNEKPTSTNIGPLAFMLPTVYQTQRKLYDCGAGAQLRTQH